MIRRKGRVVTGPNQTQSELSGNSANCTKVRNVGSLSDDKFGVEARFVTAGSVL